MENQVVIPDFFLEDQDVLSVVNPAPFACAQGQCYGTFTALLRHFNPTTAGLDRDDIIVNVFG